MVETVVRSRISCSKHPLLPPFDMGSTHGARAIAVFCQCVFGVVDATSGVEWLAHDFYLLLRSNTIAESC